MAENDALTACGVVLEHQAKAMRLALIG